MQIKALFLDVDQTLLTMPAPISAANLAAISRAQEAGIYVTLATGRTCVGARPVWEAMGVEGPLVVYGGAMAIDTRTEETLFLEGIPLALTHEALDFAHEHGIYAQLYDHDTVVTEREADFLLRYTGKQGLSYRIEPDLRGDACFETPKVLLAVDPDAVPATLALFRERFEGRLEIAASLPGFVELNRFGCNKGTAILRIADLLGIPHEATAACGDNTLDLEMIRMAGFGACVENGQQIVKDAADIVIPACEDDGVAWFIDHCLLA